MKKALLFISSLLILCSCNANNDTDKAKRYDIELNSSNYLKYFEESGIYNISGIQDSYSSNSVLKYSNVGVLDYALYENVVVKLDVKVDDVVHPNLQKVIELRSDGYGYVEVPSDTIYDKNSSGQDLTIYKHSKALLLNSISGKVIVSI